MLLDVPTQRKLDTLRACAEAKPVVTESWSRWYKQQYDATIYMRHLALSYSE